MSSTPKYHMVPNPYLKKRKRPDLDEQQKQCRNSCKALARVESSSTSPKLAANSIDQTSHSTQSTNTNDSASAGSVPSIGGGGGGGTIRSSSASALIISAADKAGMEGIDRSKIDAIILRESGNSLYMQQQRQRDEKVNQRIRQLQERLQQASSSSSSSSTSPSQITTELEEQLDSYQRQQPTRSTCVVVDMDMFFMACELLSRPHLRHVPACVGRGMITTSNYVARRYGVRSAMAGFIGDKLVEELSGGTQRLIHVPSNFDLYREKSHIVKDVLREYDPYQMKSYSLDEAYLDIGPYLALYLQHQDWTHEQIRDRLIQDKEEGHHQHSPAVATTFLQSLSSLTCNEAANHIVAQLRQRVEKATGGLTCSAGIAPNVSLAKIASDKNKPNGQLLVDPSRVLEFVHALPIRKIPGIGRVTEKILQQVCDVYTVHDLYQQRGLVHWLFPPATAEFLLKACVGCNGSSTITTSDFGMDEPDLGTDASSSLDHQKGISRERTFPPETDWSQLCIRLEDISRKLAMDMSKKSVLAHTVTVKVKLTSFDVLSRSQSMKRGVYIQRPEELVECANHLFGLIRARFKKDHAESSSRFSVRLLGIRCSNLISESILVSSDRGTMDQFLKTQSATLDLDVSDTAVVDENNTSTDLRGDTHISVVNKYTPCKTSKNLDRTRSPTRWMESDHVADKRVVSKPKILPYLKIDSPRSEDIGRNEKAITIKTTNTINTTTPIVTASTKIVVEDFVYCPLCNRQFSSNDNAGLNAHIDTCLNSCAIRRTIQEAATIVAEPKTKVPKRLTDFWMSTQDRGVT